MDSLIKSRQDKIKGKETGGGGNGRGREERKWKGNGKETDLEGSLTYFSNSSRLFSSSSVRRTTEGGRSLRMGLGSSLNHI